MTGSNHVRLLRDGRMADAAEIGRKAASLGELLATGFRVPDGVVLTSGTVDLPEDDRRSLVRIASDDLGAGPFAVRSSGIAEDGADHSYAGIFESVLDVPADELPAAVDRVLASVRATRAAEYEHGSGGRMAVIVQRMVRAGGRRRGAHRRPDQRGSTLLRRQRRARPRRAAGVGRRPR